MKKLLIVGIIPLLFACSAKDAEQKLDKGAQLKKYKSELAIIKSKISDLEKEVMNLITQMIPLLRIPG